MTMKLGIELLLKGAENVQSGITSVKGTIAGLGQAFKEGMREGMDQALKESQRLPSELEKIAADARKALNIRPDIEIEADIRATKAAYEDLKNSGVATAGELNRAKDAMKKKIGELREEMGKWSGDWEALGKKATEVGGKLESAGMRITALGAAGAAGVGTTVKAFAEQEASGALLKSTMTTAEGLSANFERVHALAIKLGNTLPGNTRDFDVMINKLLQLGVTEEAVLGGVGAAAANLAVVMKLPYEEAAVMAAKLKEATGTSEKDMLKFMDTIQRVAHQGVEPTEMMYAFARSAGGLKQFGIQGEENSRKVAGLYAQLIKLGASGETVGTGFNSALNAFAKFEFGLLGEKKSAQIDAELQRLGISLDFFDDKTKEFKGIDNFIAQLDKLKKVDQESMQKILGGILGGGQDQQFMIALAKGGTEGAKKMQDLMSAQGDINTRVGQQLDTLASKWEAATGTFENFLAALGEKIAPSLKELVDWFGEMSAKAQEFVEKNPELAKWLGLTAAAVSGTAIVAGTGLMAVGAAMQLIGPALGAISAGWGAAAAFFTNPVVLAIAGVAGAAAGGYAVGTKIAEQIDKIVEALTGTNGATLGTALYDMIEGENGIMSWPAKMQAKAGEWIAAGSLLVDNLKAGIQAKAAELLTGLGIVAQLEKGIKIISGTVAGWRKVGADIIEGLWEGIKATMRKPLDAIGELATKLPQWAKDLLNIKSPSRVFAEIGQNIGAGMAGGITDSTPAVEAAITDQAEAAIEAVKALIDDFTDIGVEAKEALANAFADQGSGLFTDYTDSAVEAREQITELMRAAGYDAIAAMIDSASDAITDMEVEALDEIDELAEAFAETLNQYADTDAPQQITAQAAAVDKLTAELKDLGTTAANTGAQTRDWLGRFLPADAGQAAIEEIKRAEDAITQGLTESIMRGLEGGMDWVEIFTAKLKEVFGAMVLRPIIQPIAAAGKEILTGSIGLAASSFANASTGVMGGIGSALSSFFTPGAIAAGMGTGFGLAAANIGAAGYFGGFGANMALAGSSLGAGAFGTAIGAAAPYLLPVLAIASLLGNRKPSDKSANGIIDIGTGEIVAKGGMTGKKAPSEETKSARDAMLTTAGAWADAIRGLGGDIAGQLRFSVGERDGFRADFGADGSKEIVEKEADAFFASLFDAMTERATGLSDAMRGLLSSFDGTSDEALAFAQAMVGVKAYLDSDLIGDATEQIRLAGRTAYQIWADAGTELNDMTAAFDGSLASAQSLGTATATMYQTELALVGQIQGMLASTSAMFSDSIRTIELSVLDSAGKYDYIRAEIDAAFTSLGAAVDPQAIGDLASQINRLTMEAYALLDGEQKAGVADEYTAYLRDVNTLAADRLNAAQAQVENQHAAMVGAIESAMERVAARMEAAAAAQQAAASTPVTVDSRVTVDVNVDTPANVEVGYQG